MHQWFASTGSRWKTALFRLACIVSLWQAPVPWVHIHAAEVDLQEHLAAFHSHVDEFATLGWHWHAVLPPWGQTEPTGDAPDATLRVQFATAIPGSVLDFGVAPAVSLTDMAIPTDQLRVIPAPVGMRHFLASLLADHTAQVVLNVRLC